MENFNTTVEETEVVNVENVNESSNTQEETKNVSIDIEEVKKLFNDNCVDAFIVLTNKESGEKLISNIAAYELGVLTYFACKGMVTDFDLKVLSVINNRIFFEMSKNDALSNSDTAITDTSSDVAHVTPTE